MFLPSLICLGFGPRDIFFKCSRLRMQGQGINSNFGKMTFLRHLGKPFRLNAYPWIVRHIKCNWETGGFLFRLFCLEKISRNAILGPFPYAKTKALNMRKNIK